MERKEGRERRKEGGMRAGAREKAPAWEFYCIDKTSLLSPCGVHSFTSQETNEERAII